MTAALRRFEKPWRAWTYAVIDVEGSGPQDKEEEALLEVAAVRLVDGRITDQVYHSLINPGRPLKSLPWLVHGLRDDDLKEAPSLDEVRPPLVAFLQHCVLVAHNARIDWRLLRRTCPDLEPLAVLDTLRLARLWYPQMPRHRLADLIDAFGAGALLSNLTNSRLHRALYDAMGLAHIFIRMLSERFTPDGTMAELFRLSGIEPREGRPLVDDRQRKLL